MTNLKIYDKENRLLKAGGLIVRNNNGTKEVLLISSEKRSWSFPKGHLEENETLEQCAIRECREETGLDLEILSEIPTHEYEHAETKEDIIIHMFLMRVLGGRLQKETQDDELKWVAISEASKYFEYKDLVDYLELVKEKIKEERR